MKSKDEVSRRELLHYLDNDVKEFLFAFKICLYVGVIMLYILVLDGVVW